MSIKVYSNSFVSEVAMKSLNENAMKLCNYLRYIIMATSLEISKYGSAMCACMVRK